MATKRIVKPTAAEKRIIDARLKRKYPQMYEAKLSARELRAYRDLSPADRRAIEDSAGKKLKKLYGGY